MLRFQQQTTLLLHKYDVEMLYQLFDKKKLFCKGLGFSLSQEMYSLNYNSFVLCFFHFFTVITESNLKDTRLNRKRPPTLVSSDAEGIRMDKLFYASPIKGI